MYPTNAVFGRSGHDIVFLWARLNAEISSLTRGFQQPFACLSVNFNFLSLLSENNLKTSEDMLQKL